jgi:cyanate lyase
MTNDRFCSLRTRQNDPFVIGHLFRRLPDHSGRVLSGTHLALLDPSSQHQTYVPLSIRCRRADQGSEGKEKPNLGTNSLSAEDANKLGALLDLGPDIVSLLQSSPKKGSRSQDIPKDPLLYRFHEINLVYGDTLKELIHEKFGDGIMSAIDFTMEVEKVEDPKGDRVKVTMCGKFLPYKKW